MSAEDLSEQEVFERLEGILRDWLRSNGRIRVDIDCHVIHRIGFTTNRLTINDQHKGVLLPTKMDFTMDDLHPAQIDPHQGVWLYSHLWMDAFDGVLHQESD